MILSIIIIEETQDIAIKAIKDLTKQEMDKDIVAKAMARITYTTEIDEEVLKEFGQSSFDLEFLKEQPNFDGLVDSSPLINIETSQNL